LNKLILFFLSTIFLFASTPLWEQRYKLDSLLFKHQMAFITSSDFNKTSYDFLAETSSKLKLQMYFKKLKQSNSIEKFLLIKNQLLVKLEENSYKNESFRGMIDFSQLDESVDLYTLFSFKVKKAFTSFQKSNLKSSRGPLDLLYKIHFYLESLSLPMQGGTLLSLTKSILQKDLVNFKIYLKQVELLVFSLKQKKLDDTQLDKKIKSFIRFNKMVAFDYKNGIEDGEIKVQLEYTEAVMFSARARGILLDIKSNLDSKTTNELIGIYDKIVIIIEKKESSKEVTKLTKKAKNLILSATGLKEVKESSDELIANINNSLNLLKTLVSQDDFKTAEILRIEAYSFFDPDIEQRLIPRNPTLSSKLEGLFWDGDGVTFGLGYSIKRQNKLDTIKAIKKLSLGLEDAKKILNKKLSFNASIIQSSMIIIREGLEALLVIALLFSLLKQTSDRRILFVGILAGLIASFATYWATKHIISISTSNRELIEGVSALLASLMLVFVTAWIFHNTYSKGWSEYAKELAQKSISSKNRLVLFFVGFLVIYREGFETVLFYETLGNEAGVKPVLIGFVGGLIVVIIMAVALFKFVKKLPLNLFFSVTGIFLSVLAVIFVGAGIRGLQTANMLNATPSSYLPSVDILSSYFGYFPTIETTIAQISLASMFAGLYFYSKRSVR